MPSRNPFELPSEPGQSFDDQVYHLTSGLFAELERQISKLPQHWRYWHIYKKRAIHFVTPPLDTPELVSQLKGLDALICQDEGLVDAVKQWIQMAEHPQPASDTSNLGSQHA